MRFFILIGSFRSWFGTYITHNLLFQSSWGLREYQLVGKEYPSTEYFCNFFLISGDSQ